MKIWPPIPFVIFSFAFIVFGVLSTFELTCPVDGGTGILKAAHGLKIRSVDSKLISEKEVVAPGLVCASTRKRTIFTYAVNMSITNESNESNQGTVSVIFNRIANETLVQNFEGGIQQGYQPITFRAYIAVLPAGTTRNIERVFSFIDDPLLPQEPPHEATVMAGQDIPDPTCSGTGKLSFVHWLQAKLKGPASLQ